MEHQKKHAQKGQRIKKKMSNEEIEKKKKVIKRSFFVAILVIILFGILLIASNYIIFDNNKKVNLVINNNNVTSDLKNEVLIEDGNIYLSKQDIANFFDKYIYEEEQTNQIITTYEKKVAAIGFEDNIITINGSKKNIYAHAIKKDNVIYLPVSQMTDVYDVDIQNIEESKVVTMDSLDKELIKTIVSSNMPVKSSTKLIAKTIDKVKKGDTVVLISSNKGYSKIRTQNGKIGFVKSDKLENEFVVRQAMEEESFDKTVNLTWDYFSKYGQAPNRANTSIEGVNVVSPAFFYLDDDGKLEENVGNSGEEYIKWAHNNGYQVWPMISNAEAGLTVTSEIMNSYTKRQELIEDIVDMCVKYKIDGVNVDFENMKQEDKDLYSRFIIELTPRVQEMGLLISVDVTAPDGAETWSMCFDRHVIGDVADYIIFMAYDQYGVSSTKPGTTAGYDWVKLSLNKFLQTEDIEPEKIILAIPLYTRVWTTNSDGKSTSNTVAMKNIEKVIPNGTEKKWDDDLKQNYVEYSEQGNKKEIWIEDIDSLKAKISLIKENNLAGVASWQKDMETEEVWTMIKQELNIN